MPTLSDNSQQFVINADSVFLNNNNDKHNSHIVIQTKGDVNENDIEFSTCNVKVIDGDFSTKRIKDLAGNAVIDINTNAIDFKNSAISNFNLGAGSVTASTVASANGYASLDLELDAHLALINGKISQNGHTANKIFVSSNGGALTTTGNCTPTDLAKLATNGAVDLNTAKTGLTSSQASAITANTAKVGITPTQASDITANNAKTGITSSQASAIVANTAKTGISSSQASAITANTAKVGITSTQASDITANNAKTGITSSQASAIVANTAKTGITSSQASAIVANTNKTGITSSQASAIVANTNKTGITSSQASAITANTAKTGITSSQASAITANTAKTGITSSQASAITANTAKTGITSSQASAISSNSSLSNLNTQAISLNSQNITNVGSLITSNDADIAAIETKTDRITYQNDVALNVETWGNLTVSAGAVGGTTSYVTNKNGNLTLKGGYDGSNDSGKISLFTDNTERMTILDSGDVGIGTNSPKSILNLYTANPELIIQDTETSSTNADASIYLTESGANGAVGHSYRMRYNHRDLIFSMGDYPQSTNIEVMRFYETSIGGAVRVGIGTTSPACNLEVNGSTSMGMTTRGFLSSAGTIGLATNTGNGPVTIKATGGYVWATYAVIATSDERIKENIVEVNDNLALQKVRDISCCWYNYKDRVSRGDGRVLGFIAQQVKEHLPEAISIQKSILPDEMKKIHTSWNETKMSSNDLQDVSGIKYRFYVSNDISGNEKMVELVGDEDNCFTFEEKWENVFCYGKEVDDFHTLDKQKLFALNFSATQELDRQVTQLKQENQQLKARLDALEEILTKKLEMS